MEEFKVGEYVRTDKGLIDKIIGFKEDEILFEKDSMVQYKTFNYIVKHSFNIIDLIKEGDYVNGYKVSDKESTLLCTNVKGIDKSGYHIPISQYGEGIETIVTKEQFESMEYKVGD